MTGNYFDTGNNAFVDINGVFTSLAVPGTRAGTIVASSINNAGQIAGSYIDALSGVEHGYVDTNGVFTWPPIGLRVAC